MWSVTDCIDSISHIYSMSPFYISVLCRISNAIIVLSFVAINSGSKRTFKMIIILEKDKITQEIKYKLLDKGLTLIGMSDKE